MLNPNIFQTADYGLKPQAKMRTAQPGVSGGGFVPTPSNPMGQRQISQQQQPNIPSIGGFNFPFLDLGQYREYGGGNKSVGDPMNMAKLLSQGFMPLLLQQLQQSYKNEPRRQKALESGLNAMDPARRQGIAERFRRQVLSQGTDLARRQQATLGSQGMSQAMQQGLMLDAQNRAESQSNDFASSLYSPEFDLQSAQGQLSLMDQGQFGALAPFLQLAAAGQAPPQPDKPTFWESLLGIGASAIPFIGGKK